MKGVSGDAGGVTEKWPDTLLGRPGQRPERCVGPLSERYGRWRESGKVIS
jgi:hypothetical protein